jgi:hypothetical protein
MLSIWSNSYAPKESCNSFQAFNIVPSPISTQKLPITYAQKKIISTSKVTASDLSTKVGEGDLVWAKVTGHPWWPSKITRNPPSGMSEIKIVGTVIPENMCCVLFVGRQEWAWMPVTSLIEYDGFERFKKVVQKKVDFAKSKREKINIANQYEIKFHPSRRESWLSAIKEADIYLEKRPCQSSSSSSSTSKTSVDFQLTNVNSLKRKVRF